MQNPYYFIRIKQQGKLAVHVHLMALLTFEKLQYMLYTQTKTNIFH